jgi:hypothetical protein
MRSNPGRRVGRAAPKLCPGVILGTGEYSADFVHNLVYTLCPMESFIWDQWNAEHATRHGVTIDEIEYVVSQSRSPWPMPHGDLKFLVRGRTQSGRYIQVIYVLESDAESIDYSEVDLVELADAADAFYVIHARPLNDDEKRTLRKLNRRKGKR